MVRFLKEARWGNKMQTVEGMMLLTEWSWKVPKRKWHLSWALKGKQCVAKRSLGERTCWAADTRAHTLRYKWGRVKAPLPTLGMVTGFEGRSGLLLTICCLNRTTHLLIICHPHLAISSRWRYTRSPSSTKQAGSVDMGLHPRPTSCQYQGLLRI